MPEPTEAAAPEAFADRDLVTSLEAWPQTNEIKAVLAKAVTGYYAGKRSELAADLTAALGSSVGDFAEAAEAGAFESAQLERSAQ